MSDLPMEGSRSSSLKFISLVVGSILSILGLVLCAKMLSWVIDNKTASIQPMVQTEITAQYRQRQLTCLARNIYYEAGNEPFEGKVAVAQVTINRALAAGFPDDICKVIYQKNVIYERVVCQFSWYCDRVAQSRIIHSEIYNESMEVAKKVLLEGFKLPALTQALYYHADYVKPNWNRTRVAKIGRHIFYQ